MPNKEDELMPYQTLANIKNELMALKRKAGSLKGAPSKEFYKAVDRISHDADSLLSLFEEAAKSMEAEKREKKPGLKEQAGFLAKRLDEIEEENKQIAQGILAIADMLKDLKEEEKKIEEEINFKPKPIPIQKPVFRQMQMPPQAPYPMPRAEQLPEEMPPAPHAPPARQMPPPAPFPGREFREFRPAGQTQMRMPEFRAVPPYPRPMPWPSPLPPLPEIRGEPKKEGLFSKLFKRK